MTFTLFVGDINNEVCDAAHTHDDTAQLITLQNLTCLSDKTYYTSLADCGSLENLSSVCGQAHEIYYVQPSKWSDCDRNNVSNQEKWTELILRYFQQTKPVYNLPAPTMQSWLKQTRVAEKQFWVVGCSITAGVGVTKDQSWPELVSKELNLPYTDLSLNGSSIIWQSDQICRSHIQPGEIVFWGVTSPNRMPIITPDQTLMHLTVDSFSTNHYAIENLTPDLISNDTLKYHNILAVKRAYNYCQRIGASLVPLGVTYDLDNLYIHYDIPPYQQLIQWGINNYADLGSNQKHPGPIQHTLYAEKFLSHYKKIYS